MTTTSPLGYSLNRASLSHRNWGLGESVQRVPPYRTHHDAQSESHFVSETTEELAHMREAIEDYNHVRKHPSPAKLRPAPRGVPITNTAARVGSALTGLYTDGTTPMTTPPRTPNGLTTSLDKRFMSTYGADFAKEEGSKPATPFGIYGLHAYTRPGPNDPPLGSSQSLNRSLSPSRRNVVIGCRGSQATFNAKATRSLSYKKIGQTSGFVNSSSTPGRTWKLDATGKVDENNFGTTYKKNFKNFRPYL